MEILELGPDLRMDCTRKCARVQGEIGALGLKASARLCLVAVCSGVRFRKAGGFDGGCHRGEDAREWRKLLSPKFDLPLVAGTMSPHRGSAAMRIRERFL